MQCSQIEFFFFPLPQFIKRIRYSARLVVWTKVTENSKCLKVASINGLKLEDDKKEETDQKELSKPYSGQVAKTSVSTARIRVERWTLNHCQRRLLVNSSDHHTSKLHMRSYWNGNWVKKRKVICTNECRSHVRQRCCWVNSQLHEGKLKW